MSHCAWALLATLVLAGCPRDESTETTPSAPEKSATTAEATAQPTAKPTAAATTQPSTELTVDRGETPPGITPRVKSELDGRSDGATGPALAVTGGKATFSSVKGWKNGKSGTWTTSTAADGKAMFGAGALKASDDVAAKATEAATALGLTDCKWGATDTATVGKDKLTATVADGICKHNGADAPAAYAAFAGNGVIAVGGWDKAGGDRKGVFDVFRSVKKIGGGGGGLAACCAALQQNAASAPPQQKGAYIAAAGACRAAMSNPQGRAALAQIRAMLAGANVPATCR